VGVSHACDYPPEIRDLPRVTRSSIDTSGPAAEIDAKTAQALAAGQPPITVDHELLARLAPDLVLSQSVCEVCAVNASQLKGEHVVSLHAHRLDDVFADMLRVGDALGLRDEADELVAGLRYRLRAIGTGARRTAHTRVLVLEWLSPPYVAGHWVPELVAAAGGVDVGARPGERSLKRSWTDLRGLAPDVVIIALCGFDVPRAEREWAAITAAEALALFRGSRVAFLDGNAYTSRPGPRVVDGAERLAQLIQG
jgi:iron complex transport system substrate-binding protein